MKTTIIGQAVRTLVIAYMLLSLSLSAQDLPKDIIPKKADKYGMRCGYISKSSGKWLTKKDFETCEEFKNEKYAVVAKFVKKSSQKIFYGFIDYTGKIVVPLIYSYASNVRGGFAMVSLSKKRYTDDVGYQSGIIDVGSNKIVMPLEFNYETLAMFNNANGDITFFCGAKKKKYSRLDEIHFYGKEGELLGVYDSYKVYSDGYVVVKKDGLYEVFDLNFNKVLPQKFSNVFSDGNNLFNEGKASFTLAGKLVFIDRHGNVLNTPTTKSYSEIRKESFNRRVVRDGQYYGYIDENGKEITPIEFTEANDFRSDLYATYKKGNSIYYGLIDYNGKIVVGCCKYEYIDNFIEGLALVRREGKYGFINEQGKEVIPTKYKDCTYFNKGVAVCSYDGEINYEVYPDGRELMIQPKPNQIVEPLPRKCLQSCTDCGGTGTRMIRTANKCGYCDGKGTIGFDYYTIGGRTYREPKACSRCEGSGRSFGSTTTFENCKTCNQTGCLKFE